MRRKFFCCSQRAGRSSWATFTVNALRYVLYYMNCRYYQLKRGQERLSNGDWVYYINTVRVCSILLQPRIDDVFNCKFCPVGSYLYSSTCVPSFRRSVVYCLCLVMSEVHNSVCLQLFSQSFCSTAFCGGEGTLFPPLPPLTPHHLHCSLHNSASFPAWNL
jgi:hypothetical protein